MTHHRFLSFYYYNFHFLLGEEVKREGGSDIEGLGNEGDWGAQCEIYKESIKNYGKKKLYVKRVKKQIKNEGGC